MKSAALIRSALASCLMSTTACAFPSLVPVELVPSPAGDGGGAAGALAFSARTGPDWIELDVENPSDGSAMIDWTGSAFITARGHAHALVTADHVLGITQRPWRVDEGPGSGGALGYRQAVVSTATPDPGAHTVPSALTAVQHAKALIRPHGTHHAIVYPAEHVVLAPNGYFVTALFCDAPRSARGSGDSGRAAEGSEIAFSLILRVFVDGLWQNVELRAREAKAPLAAAP